MKLSKLIAFSLLVTLNVAATEAEETNLAPPSLVQEFHDYCSEIRPDDEDGNEYITGCVNAQLADSGFDTFSYYSEMIAHMNKEDDE